MDVATRPDPRQQTVITLREMALSDVEAVAAIEADVSTTPWSEKLFADEFTVVEPSSRGWVVATGSDGSVIGFGGVMLVGDEGHIMNIATRPDHQGRGIGQAILSWLWHRALNAGALHLTLEVRVGNEAARRLYQRFGFAPVGVRSGYYQDGEDALILWAHDIAPLELQP